MSNLTVKEAIELLQKLPGDAYIQGCSSIRLESRFEVHIGSEEAYDRGYDHGYTIGYETGLELARP